MKRLLIMLSVIRVPTVLIGGFALVAWASVAATLIGLPVARPYAHMLPAAVAVALALTWVTVLARLRDRAEAQGAESVAVGDGPRSYAAPAGHPPAAGAESVAGNANAPRTAVKGGGRRSAGDVTDRPASTGSSSRSNRDASDRSATTGSSGPP